MNITVSINLDTLEQTVEIPKKKEEIPVVLHTDLKGKQIEEYKTDLYRRVCTLKKGISDERGKQVLDYVLSIIKIGDPGLPFEEKSTESVPKKAGRPKKGGMSEAAKAKISARMKELHQKRREAARIAQSMLNNGGNYET